MVSSLNKMKGAVLIASALLIGVQAHAQTCKVRADRPRIWLTPEILDQLRSDVSRPLDSLTSSEIAPEAKARAYMGSSTSAQSAMSASEPGAISRALEYVISGDKKVGRQAVQEVKELLEWGTPRLRAWGGFAKYLIHPVAICYDWCHNLLTPTEKKDFLNALKAWGKLCSSKVANENPYGSQFYAYLWGEAVVGMAIAGDDPEGQRLVDHARYEIFGKKGRPALEKMGGVWPEGNEFYFGPVLVTFYLEALKTACGENLFPKTSFISEAVLNHIYGGHCYTKRFHPSGGAVRYKKVGPRLHLNVSSYDTAPEHSIFLALARSNLGDTPEAGHAQWLLDQIAMDKNRPVQAWTSTTFFPYLFWPAGQGASRVPYANWLWSRCGQLVKPLPPTGLDTVYHDRRSGFVSMRDSWDSKALAVTFQSGPSWGGLQHGDQNAFTVVHNGGFVLGPYMAMKNGTRNRLGRRGCHAKCNMLFDGHGQTESSTAENSGRIIAFSHTPHFAYVVGEAAAAYNDRSWSYEPVKTYTRHMLMLRPSMLLILDHVVTKKGVRKEWGAWAPNSKGKLVSAASPWRSVDTKQPSFLWAPLLPENARVGLQASSSGNRLYVTPKDQDEESIFLNVFTFTPRNAPELTCRRTGRLVNITIKQGSKRMEVQLAADAPSKSRVSIKDNSMTAFAGELVK